jgi:hypothetical protein
MGIVIVVIAVGVLAILAFLELKNIGEPRSQPGFKHLRGYKFNPTTNRWEENNTPKVPVCDCGNDLRKGGKFYEGPSGGMSTNIQCAECGQWWNFCSWCGDVIQWDRLHKESLCSSPAVQRISGAVSNAETAEGAAHAARPHDAGSQT